MKAWNVSKTNLLWKATAAIDWLGKRLPLLRYIQLPTGSPALDEAPIAKLVIFSRDCGACQGLLHRLEERKSQGDASEIAVPIFVIDMARHPTTELPFDAPNVILATLSREREWRFATPLVIEMERGKVVAVSETL